MAFIILYPLYLAFFLLLFFFSLLPACDWRLSIFNLLCILICREFASFFGI